MLTIGKLGLGQQKYYEKQVARGRDDYYSGRGEAPGVWIGAGAGGLGLEGQVAVGQFDALLEGSDPRAPGERLRASNRQLEVAALDLTFSAPKSVSVLFAVGPAEVSAALVECHEEAVQAALGFIDEEAVFVRRGKGGARFEHAGGLIAAAYRHRMSRAMDPQLHTHVVAANLAQGGDGRYTALHHPSLYRAARTAGFLYQAHLRATVCDRLGLEWGPVVKGAAELRDFPVAVLAVFSQRRAQVQVAIAEREALVGRALTRAERSQYGAIATRERKQYGVDTHTWREEVTARAAEHGLDRDFVDRVVAVGGDRMRSGAIAVEGELVRHGEAVGEDAVGRALAGPAGLTERSNTFDGWSVLREFAAAAAQGARVRSVRELGERFAGREDVLATTRGTLTTADLAARERALVDGVMRRVGEGVAQLSEREIAAAIDRSDRVLNADQAAAVRAVAGSGSGVDVIEALAGTGKTYTAGVLRELYTAAGYSVLGVAPSARAVRELVEQAGVASRTLDSRLLGIANGYGLPGRSVMVFEEAGMASTRQTERLLAHAALVGVKVIAIGDPGQLPSVQAGGWLRAVSERLGAARLTEVMRQRDPAERLALAGLHDGAPSRWLDWATRAGRVEVVADETTILERAVAEWAGGVDEYGVTQSALIARDNETRRALNRLAREQRRTAGMLGEDRSYGPVTVAVGDRVICRSNERDLDIDNGTRGTIRHTDRSGVLLETDGRTTRELPAAYVAEHVEHAYALTGHGMQGATVEQATVVAGVAELTRGWSYTALSRARGQTRLLVRDDTPEIGQREDIGPVSPHGTPGAREVLGRVARRMLERDDEDLAIDQLRIPGAADDPQLIRAAVPAPEPPQEGAAERPQPPVPAVTASRSLVELSDRLEQLRAQLAALPVQELEQLEQLDARAVELAGRRDAARAALERLPVPRTRRLGRTSDPHLVDRGRLVSMLAGLEAQLERTLADRAALARQVGDIEPIRSERDGLIRAIGTLRREHHQLLDELTQQELATRPRWLKDVLGERPQRRSDAERWDRAARTTARYRIQYAPRLAAGDALGPEPDGGDQHRDYQAARLARERLRGDLERERLDHELDLG
ncbi:MAG: MobF family relaxase [Solirubrobacteraceae bacterium]